jgi:hypothetical protein
VSTTGNGASPGDFFGGSAASPAQENSGRNAARPPNARSERRRISERLAEAAEAPGATETGRARGMPNSSPWQRSNAVWHRAGIDWSRAEPSPRPAAPPAAVPAPRPAPPYPAPVVPAHPAEVAPGDAASGDEPWAAPRRRRLPSFDGLPVRPVAVAVVAVLIAGVGAYLLFGGDGDKKSPGGAPAVFADRMFALDPAAATGGRTHTLDAVVAAGGTAVAIGSEQGGVYSRAQFLASADGGRSWHVATVRAANGGDPPQGEYPGLLAGGAGAWAALGSTPDGTVAWTSRDTRTWLRHAPSGAFVPGDQVKGLARTGSGFVAVGTATANGATRAVVWTSADGGRWTRLGGDPFGGVATGPIDIAAHGDVVVAHGHARTAKTVTEKVRGKKRKAQRTVVSEAFWRSADGGRSWTPVTVPQGLGSSGGAVSVAATQTGFFTAREASRTTGSKKHRKKAAFGAFFSSPDGSTWAPAGALQVTGYSSISTLAGADAGLTVLVSLHGGRTAVMTSGDGKTWRHVADLPGGRTLTGAALTSQGPVVTGRLDGGDAYLAMGGMGDVNLAAVPDAVHPERTVAGITADAGRVVAVGSTNGRAALWTSPNGTAWTRAQLPAVKDPGRLVDAVHGGAGWLAVGAAGAHPLALTSADGGTWQPAPDGTGTGLAVSAAAATGGGYVIVGSEGGKDAGAWASADLKSWTHATSAAKDDLTGGPHAPKWMSDVTAGPAGFVAVGGQTGKASQPAVWTSPDGHRWTLSTTPPALPAGTTQGSLTKVVARGGVLVATGVAGSYVFASVSADGGRTWRPAALPGAAAGTALTAATATPRGFVLVGTAGSDVATWSSPDGRTWRVARPHGLGLDGPGEHRLDGVTAAGKDLLAVGFTGDSRRDRPTLWRTPVP